MVAASWARADAVKLGIARALMVFNPELRKALKAEGLVTRDSRGKERKKYGQKGAPRTLPVLQAVKSSYQLLASAFS